MILIEKPTLKFLLAGRTITVTTGRPYRQGRSYAVGLAGNKTICRARVLSVIELDDGFSLKIRQASEETPRLLARDPGAQRRDYVERPGQAAWDEPEAVDEDTQRRLTELGTLRWRQEHARREAQRAAMKLQDRIAEIERLHGRGRADVSRQLAAIRTRLDALKRIAA